MADHEMREGVYRCPNGCDFDDLEIGGDYSSFGAVLGIPWQVIRCGKCGFMSEPKQGDRTSTIAEWNRAARAFAEDNGND